MYKIKLSKLLFVLVTIFCLNFGLTSCDTNLAETNLLGTYALETSTQKQDATQTPPASDEETTANIGQSLSTKADNVESQQNQIAVNDATPADRIKPNIQQAEKNERIVYITRTGHKYHRDSCRYLSRSRIPINLSDAISEGYEPCSVCRP